MKDYKPTTIDDITIIDYEELKNHIRSMIGYIQDYKTRCLAFNSNLTDYIRNISTTNKILMYNVGLIHTDIFHRCTWVFYISGGSASRTNTEIPEKIQKIMDLILKL